MYNYKIYQQNVKEADNGEYASDFLFPTIPFPFSVVSCINNQTPYCGFHKESTAKKDRDFSITNQISWTFKLMKKAMCIYGCAVKIVNHGVGCHS